MRGRLAQRGRRPAGRPQPPVGLGAERKQLLLRRCREKRHLGILLDGTEREHFPARPRGCGEWFLNASFQYQRLGADNLIEINDGKRNVFLGRVGIGFVF